MRSFYTIASGSVTVYTHYLYDAAGQRVKKLTRKNDGTLIESTTYIDGIFEHHKKNSEEKNYIQIQGGIEKRIGYFDGDMEDTVHVLDIYTISDYLSSATMRLNGLGQEIDREDYYPYGDSAVRSYTQKRYRFTGKEKDEESGLYYYEARYYASWCMKFLSVDPLAGKFAHQSNYCYADCNPVVKNDPSGMGTEDNDKSKQVDNLNTEKNQNDNANSSAQEVPEKKFEEGNVEKADEINYMQLPGDDNKYMPVSAEEVHNMKGKDWKPGDDISYKEKSGHYNVSYHWIRNSPYQAPSDDKSDWGGKKESHGQYYKVWNWENPQTGAKGNAPKRELQEPIYMAAMFVDELKTETFEPDLNFVPFSVTLTLNNQSAFGPYTDANGVNTGSINPVSERLLTRAAQIYNAFGRNSSFNLSVNVFISHYDPMPLQTSDKAVAYRQINNLVQGWLRNPIDDKGNPFTGVPNNKININARTNTDVVPAGQIARAFFITITGPWTPRR